MRPVTSRPQYARMRWRAWPARIRSCVAAQAHRLATAGASSVIWPNVVSESRSFGDAQKLLTLTIFYAMLFMSERIGHVAVFLRAFVFTPHGHTASRYQYFSRSMR